MKELRRLLGLLLAVLLPALAMPSLAAPTRDKVYSLTVTTTATLLKADYLNVSPDGNSVINSIIFTVTPSSGPGPLPTDLTKYILKLNGTVIARTVSVSADRTAVRVSGFTGARPNRLLTLEITMTPPACGSVVYGSQAFAGNSFAGDEFLLTSLQAPCQSAGSVNCGGAIGDSAAGGKRGDFDKHGGTCQAVDYTFTFNPNTLTSILKWTGDNNAIFSYSLLGAPEDVDATGYPPALPRPRVSWTFDANGEPTNITWGVACLSPHLASPYATFVGPVNDTAQTEIYVNVPSPLPAKWLALPTEPFPIIIQSSSDPTQSERMQVTKVTAVTGQPHTHVLDVIRATKNNPAGVPADATPHASGALVMSTSMPHDPNQCRWPASPGSLCGPTDSLRNPYFNKQVNMCIWDQGWTAYGINPVTGIQQFRPSVSAHDQGDGWLSSR